MKFIIQSLPAGGDKWFYRESSTGPTEAMVLLRDTIKADLRLKVALSNSYRIIDKKEKVVFTLTEAQKNTLIKL